MHIQDGRAFLHDDERRYDLILFALPDSHTLISGQASLRLESYLFTEEAMGEAYEHLRPDGTLAMYHFYTPTVIDRYAGTLDSVFGHPPCIDKRTQVGVRYQTVLTINVQPDGLDCTTPWVASGPVPAPDSDDHPFPYLVRRTIPLQYLVSLALILVASLAVVRVAAGPLRQMSSYLDLFFMGAAFLLLETKNVVQFALLFGTTWFVNALVFGGILLTVLAAVEVAKRVRFRRPSWLFARCSSRWPSRGWRHPTPCWGSRSCRGSHRDRAGFRPGVLRQPRVRRAVPPGRLVDGRLRHEPAGGDGRRGVGVLRARHRVPLAAGRGRGALRAAWAFGRRRSRLTSPSLATRGEAVGIV